MITTIHYYRHCRESATTIPPVYEGDIKLSEEQRPNNILFGNLDGAPDRHVQQLMLTRSSDPIPSFLTSLTLVLLSISIANHWNAHQKMLKLCSESLITATVLIPVVSNNKHFCRRMLKRHV